jgi:predicted CoA-binding protein
VGDSGIAKAVLGGAPATGRFLGGLRQPRDDTVLHFIYGWLEMNSPTAETVAILGASPKPDRYAYKAFEMLREYGHQPIPVNPAFDDILGEKCYPKISDAPGPIDTVTLYLGQARSNPLIDEIINAKPRRIIMNPGAENATLAEKAKDAGIEVVEGCTLVMLRTGQF